MGCKWKKAGIWYWNVGGQAAEYTLSRPNPAFQPDHESFACIRFCTHQKWGAGHRRASMRGAGGQALGGKQGGRLGHG